MEIINLLDFVDRIELRNWLEVNHNHAKSCWVVTSRSKQPTYECIPYIEVVEEALCFGWIDSTLKKLPDGRLAQRLSPRRKSLPFPNARSDRLPKRRASERGTTYRSVCLPARGLPCLRPWLHPSKRG